MGLIRFTKNLLGDNRYKSAQRSNKKFLKVANRNTDAALQALADATGAYRDLSVGLQSSAVSQAQQQLLANQAQGIGSGATLKGLESILQPAFQSILGQNLNAMESFAQQKANILQGQTAAYGQYASNKTANQGLKTSPLEALSQGLGVANLLFPSPTPSGATQAKAGAGGLQ